MILHKNLFAFWSIVGLFYLFGGFGIFGGMENEVSVWGLGMLALTIGILLCWAWLQDVSAHRSYHIVAKPIALLLTLILLLIQLPPIDLWFSLSLTSDDINAFDQILLWRHYLMGVLHSIVVLSALWGGWALLKQRMPLRG